MNGFIRGGVQLSGSHEGVFETSTSKIYIMIKSQESQIDEVNI